jgi:hypothetical protein
MPTLTGVELTFETELKELTADLVTGSIEAAFHDLGNPENEAVEITDANAFAASVAAHLGTYGGNLVKIVDIPLDEAITGAATELGNAATESSFTAYVLKHLGLD